MRAHAEFKAAFRGGRASLLCRLDFTPLLMTVFVLLVFLLCKPMIGTGLGVNLPTTAKPQIFWEATANPFDPIGDTPAGLNLRIRADHELFLNSEWVPPGQLAQRLQALGSQARHQPFYLLADRNLRYGQVRSVLGSLSRAGFSKVRLMASASQASSLAS